jgi:hypothetical protein
MNTIKTYAKKSIAQSLATRLTNSTGLKHGPMPHGDVWVVVNLEQLANDALAATKLDAYLDGATVEEAEQIDPTECLNTEEYLEHLGATPMEAALDAQVDEESAETDVATLDALEAELTQSPGIPTNGLTDLDRLLVEHVRASKTCGRGSNSCIDECYTNEELAQLFRDRTITKRRHALKLVRQVHLVDMSHRREARANARIEAGAAA